jgi:hypothetical protein
MCDAGYKVLFEKGTAQVINGHVAVNGNVVMQGKATAQQYYGQYRWTINKKQGKVKKRETNEIKNVYEIIKVYATIQYLHVTPVPSAFIKAIEAGNFTTWPTLMAQHVKKYLKKSEATVKGHLNQTRKNVKSTRPKTHHVSEDAEKEFEPHITKRTNVVYAAIHAI